MKKYIVDVLLSHPYHILHTIQQEYHYKISHFTSSELAELDERYGLSEINSFYFKIELEDDEAIMFSLKYNLQLKPIK